MAEYNPSKIIKDGNTYNFRDDTKIPLAGSNQISGSLIPATTDSVNLGSSAKEYLNAYIKSLTINGVACGDILTHNASEFVNISSNQTIGGVKTFSSGGCKFYKQIKINHNLEYGKNNPPSQSAFHNLMFTDANDWWGSFIENVTDTNGNSTLALYVRNTNEIQSRVYLKCDINGSFSMYPLSNNVWNLGISTNKWKSFNGIAPDELGLPTSTYTDVSSYITHFDYTANTITAPVSGMLYVDGGDGDVVIENNTLGSIVNFNRNPQFNNCRAIMFISKGEIINVYCNYSNFAHARIYHLKGKV